MKKMMMMMMKMMIGQIDNQLNGKLLNHLIGLDQEYIFTQILIFRNKKLKTSIKSKIMRLLINIREMMQVRNNNPSLKKLNHKINWEF